MRKLNVKQFNNSKFLNPFMVGQFIYNKKYYDCSDPETQTKLFLWMYGLNTSKKVCSLFDLPTTRYGIIELPWRRFSKLIYRIDQTKGWEKVDCYTSVLQDIYLQALEDNMVLDYEDKHLFNTATKTAWDSWIRTKILEIFPSIINDLQEKYPDINIFF